MPNETQSVDMDATQIAERHVIERYLTGQLSDSEADAFEVYVETHPEVLQEIELTARMKCGLGVLRRRGELREVLETRSRSRFRVAALAAAAACIALVAFLVIRFNSSTSRPLMLAASPEHLQHEDGSPLRLAGSYSLVRSRDVTGGQTIDTPSRPAAVELLLPAPDALPGDHFTAEVFQFARGTLEPVAALDDATSSADGNVHLFVDSRLLRAGTYVLRLESPKTQETIEFSLQVR